jgi:hypothetical protein
MLFLMTSAVVGMVIFTFVRWVDRIARLGRLDYYQALKGKKYQKRSEQILACRI